MHGHSVGGTNPSLLEAMASKTCVYVMTMYLIGKYYLTLVYFLKIILMLVK